MDPHTHRGEAERWLGIAAKLLTARDFLGSKTFAIRAREADPNNAVSDQILAVVDTVLAGEKRVNSNQQPDWYQVLQLPRLVRDPDLIADHYRRLVLCLNPERNRFPFADYALQMVMEAWSVLSDPTKKWLFDNELALYLQQGEPVVTGAAAAAAVVGSGSGSAAAVAAGGGNSGGGSQLNTFQFFQPQPLLPQQPPQQQQQHQQQQQQHHQHHQQQQQQQQQQPMWRQPQQQQQQQQINQREFMPLPIQPQQQQQQQQQQHPPQQQQQQQQHPPQQQQLPPQWQMRDPNPSKGGGGGVERSKGVLNGIGIGARVATTASPMIPTQTTHRQIPPFRPPSPPLPAVSAVPGVSVPTAIPIVDGNAGTAPTCTNDINISINNNNNDITINGAATNAAAANNENNDEYVVEDVDVDDDDVVEDVESFWTACPYCFYIYEYPKVYQECTLRCQTCRKGFHAVQIPNPPPISPANNGGFGGGKNEKEKEKEKGKDNSFCCWGFFPLGFSMTAWKKQNQAGNLNGASNWVPFSPMFNCPVENGGGGFQWFDKNDGNANVGPTHAVTKNTPQVYIDDDDILEVSEPSDLDSSDDDWRTYNQEKNKSKNKNKKKRRGRSGVLTRGRLRRDGLNQVKQNVASGGGVSVGGEHLDDGSDGQLVIGLAADKSDTGKASNASLTRKQTRRSKKDVGRLDLNVEFNNDGEEHAPTVSAVNGEEDGIESIGFFEGLDEFLSTLPILNVAGDEKAKPS